MGTSPIYGIPWPELPSQADGPAAFQAMANKLDTTLAGLAVPFTAIIPDITVSAGFGLTYSTPPITAVPLGRPVLMFAYGNFRISSSNGQFGVCQIQEGGTLVTNSTAVQAAATGVNVQFVVPMMMVVCRAFTAAPALVVSAGGSPDAVRLTEIRVTGMSFGNP
jgi:hypothetical protein